MARHRMCSSIAFVPKFCHDIHLVFCCFVQVMNKQLEGIKIAETEPIQERYAYILINYSTFGGYLSNSNCEKVIIYKLWGLQKAIKLWKKKKNLTENMNMSQKYMSWAA